MEKYQKNTLTMLILFLLAASAYTQNLYTSHNVVPEPSIGIVTDSKTVPISDAAVTPVFVFNYYQTGSNNCITNENVCLEEKFKLFQQTYTFTTPIAPGNPGLKTVVRKPPIYNSAMKLDKHYRKQIRKGDSLNQEANLCMAKVLDVAIAAFYEESGLFEALLKNTKDINELALIFENAVIKFH